MTWKLISFDGDDAARRFADVQIAFTELRLRKMLADADELDLVALYVPRSGQLTAYFTPLAAEWLTKAVPDYALTPCARPESDAVRMVIGDSIAGDPEYIGMSAVDRESVRQSLRLDDDAIAGMDEEWESMGRPTRGDVIDVYALLGNHKH